MESTIEQVRAQVAESARVKEMFLENSQAMELVDTVADLLVNTYRRGGKSLWAGNGGSAADAQHMAAELVNKFQRCRKGLPALALTVDTSILTAISNDYGYEQLFARQVEALGAPGDVFVAISTSGNSANLVQAVRACREKGIVTVALVGARPCELDRCDYVIHIPSDDTPRIQECQTLVGHIFCDRVERTIFPDV